MFSSRTTDLLAGRPALIPTVALIRPAAVEMPLPPPEPSTYRVFRHDELGLHFVLRDVAELAGYTCVYGPKSAGGEELTFADAVAFANEAFAEWSGCHRRLLSEPEANSILADLQLQAAEMPVRFGI